MRKLLPLLALGGMTLAACGDGTAPRGAGNQVQFSRQIGFQDLQRTVVQGATRVEIEFVSATPPLVARELKAKDPQEVGKDEEIRSRITAIMAAADQGTLTLALADLEVGFTAATEFRTESGTQLTLVQFVDRVRAALAANQQPAVKAERTPAATPQAPDDAIFNADELKLDDEAADPTIEINVSADNLDAPGHDICPGIDEGIEVLARCVEIRPGVTKLEAELPNAAGEVEFEAVVKEVAPAPGSCTIGTVTLMDGTVVRIVAGTEIKAESGDDEQLKDLCQVQAALAAQQIVEAEGEGVVESTAPRTIAAIEVEFKVQEQAEDIVGAVEFEATVRSVAPDANSCTLGSVRLVDGTVVRIVAGTELKSGSGDEQQLKDLCAVGDALAAGATVEAKGKGVVESTDPATGARTIIAVEAEFAVKS